VPAQGQRQSELGADAIGAGNQHRLSQPFQGQLEQRPETADAGQYTRPPGACGQGFDPVYQPVAGIDIHAGGAVAE